MKKWRKNVKCKIRDKEENRGRNAESYKWLLSETKTAVKELFYDIKGTVKQQKRYYEQIEGRKNKFISAISTCNLMDKDASNYVKDIIKIIITEKLGVSGQNVDIFLNDYLKSENGAVCRFYMLIRQYGDVCALMYDEGFMEENEEMCVVTEDRIYEVFERFYITESFVGKTDILVQMIYQELFGLGIIDFLQDVKVFDSIMGGVSYGGESERSLWVQYKGRNIYLKFAAFGCREELERICRCLSRFEYASRISAKKAYIVGTGTDGSRIVVTRPPFSESWSFFIRNFNHRYYDNINELFCDEGIEYADSLMKWLIKGCQVTGITGDQGSGKTTLLMYLIGYINKSYAIRVQEMNFELYLRKRYPDRNIVSFRETGNISVQEGLDLQKKTDGMVNILGEVATSQAGSYMIQMGMTASLFTVFTHHATTTEYLLLALRNYLIESGGFSDEDLALSQVLSVLRFDIHITKSAAGKRYIQRITEIVPKTDSNGKQQYDIVNILEYQSGRYRPTARISRERIEMISKHLNGKEKEEFYEDMEKYPKIS